MINPDDFRIRRDLYFPYTEEELKRMRGTLPEPPKLVAHAMDAHVIVSENPCGEVPAFDPVMDELRAMAYTSEGMQDLIKFVYALPGGFWKAVCQRPIATTIVVKQ